MMNTVYLRRGLVIRSVALLLLGLSLPAEAHNDKTAYAIPLSGITIDGKLDDWPREMAIYPIGWVSPGSYKSTPPDGPADLTASFRVGYDLSANLLYLAIVVEDEDLVTHPEAPNYFNQDLCEVYVDADHSGIDRSGIVMGVGEVAGAQQYMMAAGQGKASSEVDGNPALVGGNTQASGVQATVLRLDQIAVYEWAIPLFESFPEQRFQVQPGKTIGFDVVVSDADGLENGNWVAWTPGEGKVVSGRLGDLAFVEDYQRLDVVLGKTTPVDYRDKGAIIGRITERHSGVPLQGVRIAILKEDKLVLAAYTDSTGNYRQILSKGTCTLKAFARGVRDTVTQRDVEVIAGEETRVDLSLEDLGACFYVDDDALEEGDGSPDRPFQTIQKALEATSEGDTVRVLAGAYREPVVLVSGVTLLGAGPDSTILDGENKRGVVQITDVDHVVLEGFAIVRGQGRQGQSMAGEYQPPFGGILMANAHYIQIVHNLISGNISMTGGGGILCSLVDSTVVIAHNLIVGNSTERPQWGGAPGGGGIYLQGARPLIHNNTVIYNRGMGGSGGILCEGASPHLRDNIIACNLNGGLAYKRVPYLLPGQTGPEPGPRSSHNDVWNNTGYDYSGVDPGEGDMAVNPEFLAPREGDFRLSRSSPCKKAGTAGSMGADMAALQRGEQGLRAAIPPREVLKQFKGVSPAPGTPVIRKVNNLSRTLPPARKLRVDTIRVDVHPLDLSHLDRTEKLYDRSAGLPSNQVMTIAPAPDGSIWVGTYDRGAARYDGLWTYLDTLNGLPGNRVQAILPAQDGTIWIATNGGLVRYRDGRMQTVSEEDYRTLVGDQAGGLWLVGGQQAAHLDTVWTYMSFADSTARPYLPTPSLVDPKGVVWCLQTSLDISEVLRYDSQTAERYELPHPLENMRGKSILQTTDGRLWMGAFSDSLSGDPSVLFGFGFPGRTSLSIGLLDATTAHLQVHSLRLTESLPYISMSSGPSGTWASSPLSLFQDPQGLLWAFAEQAIFQFDGRHWSGARKVEFVSENAALDREENFWFGSYRGLVRYGPQTWTIYKGEERLEGKPVTSLVEDRSGNLWFGGVKGLHRRNADGTWARLTVTDTLVTDLLVDRQGQLWAATLQGVHRYDGRQWMSYTTKEGLPDTAATALAEGADGRIWAGGPKGLFWYDGQRWQKVPKGLWTPSPWSGRHQINKLHADPEGRLWIMTNGGLYVYDQGKVLDYFEMFYPERGVDLDQLFALKNPEEIRHVLKTMLKDEIDMAWFIDKVQPGQYYYGFDTDPAWLQVNQAYNQLMKEDTDFRKLSRQAMEEGYAVQNEYKGDEKPEWKALSLLGRGFISALFTDQTGAIWATTSGEGLFIHRDSTWDYYPQSALAFEGGVMGATTDHQGNTWLATSQGAVRYDGQHWTTFDAANGLADNQVNDILEDREGNIWFATAKGVTRYRPDTRPPQTRMVRGPEGTVGYGTSTLTFEFEGGDWEWEQRGLTFSYALVKGDKKPEEGDWSEWDAQKFVQIPPPGDGHFTFYVRTRDKALNADPTPAAHALYIAPPLWKVLWFQASTGFGLLLIAFSSTYAIRRRRAFLREQQARLQAQEQLNQELERELQTAHDMQMALMPKEPPHIAGFEITGRCIPANHVGGDLFQYFRQHDRLSISLADVTGHAMEAAIPVVMFSGILRSQMEVGGSVEELFHRLNRSLHGTLTGHTYVCLAMGELDPASRRFRFSNSGSPYPYHFRAATGEVVELQVDAYPLGVRPDTLYQTIEVQLEPGDRVVFCSDGIIEAASTSGELFGFERTGEVIRRGCAEDLSAEALLERIIQEVKAFSREVPQGDDQTVVVVKVES